MADPNTHDLDALSGATYFVVGRGTEGGPSSYHLSIAGITSGTSDPHWGSAGKIVANSGYSLGTIQVDLGQRGTWALGSADGAPLKPGQTTYVDGIIDQASKYAKDHNLAFTGDTAKLRTDLLSHGNGEHGRSTLTFIDKDTRNSIDAWASSSDGQQWIHKNIDYPQIKQATQSALTMLDTYGKNIPEDRRLETVALLAKTENQMPSQMAKFEKVLKDGGNYDDVLAEANKIKGSYAYYDGPKAAALAEQYKNAYRDPANAAALDRAQTKVGDANFNPSASASDPDIKEALKAIGQSGRTQAQTPPRQASLHEGAHGADVKTVQTELAKLGFTDAHGRSLTADSNFGPGTKAAVEKFQAAHGLTADGVVGQQTLSALKKAGQPAQPTLADPTHPGNGMYVQSLDAVHRLDTQLGRTPDVQSENFAAAAATAAKNSQLTGVDHVVLNNNGSQAFVVQGDLDSPLKRYAQVDVAQAVATPVAQSSAQWQQNAPQVAPAQTAPMAQQPQNPPQAQPAQPAM